MIKRLRDLPDLDATYPEPHDHALYGHGHHLRVELTCTLAREQMRHMGWASVVDLSCGNGAIAKALCDEPTLGDFAPGYPITGLIEHTLPIIGPHDVLICSETLEHLDDPLSVLRIARDKAAGLVLTTPLECWDDMNEEHLWAWNRDGVEMLMREAGWNIVAFATLDARVFSELYLYGMWVAA